MAEMETKLWYQVNELGRWMTHEYKVELEAKSLSFSGQVWSAEVQNSWKHFKDLQNLKPLSFASVLTATTTKRNTLYYF